MKWLQRTPPPSAPTDPTQASALRSFRQLAPLTLMLLLLLPLISLGLFYLRSETAHQQQVQMSLSKTQAAVQHSFEESVQNHAAWMQIVLFSLQGNAELSALFAAGDRAGLHTKVQPILQKIQTQAPSVHLYFIRPDHTKLLRAHAPEFYDDKTDHATLRLAQLTGDFFYGLEMGKMGVIALRAVLPWKHPESGALIGYVEMAIDLQELLAELRQTLYHNVALVLDKSLLTHDAYKAGMRALGRPNTWDEYEQIILLADSSFPRAALLQHKLNTINDATTPAAPFHENDYHYWLVRTPLQDVAGRPLGELLILADLTDEVRVNQQSLLINGLGVFLVGLALLAVFIGLSNRSRRKLEDSIEALKNLATQDELTGLLTRRAFDQKLRNEQGRAQRFGHSLSLLMLDLDHFKRVNDTHGHATGDVVLRELGQRIRQTVREFDVAGRYGGEELMILLPETGVEGARTLAERLLHAVSDRPIQIRKGLQIPITVSIGVASSPDHTTPEQLLARVDESMYQAKKNGRDQIALASGSEASPSDSPPEGPRYSAEEVDCLAQQGDFRSIAEAILEIQNPLVITDPNGVVLRVNAAYTRLTGYSVCEVLGKTPGAVQGSGRHDAEFYRHLWAALQHEGQWEGRIWNRRKNGRIEADWMSIMAVRNSGGQTTHYVALYSNIAPAGTEGSALAYRLNYYDPLTGLPNQKLLLEELERINARTAGQAEYAALFLIGINRFGRVNDSYGHRVADQLLIELSQRLHTVCDKATSTTRHTGDEFLVLLEGLGEDPEQAKLQAMLSAEALRDALAKPFLIKEHGLHISVSLGISLFRPGLHEAEVLLRQANMAMHYAKIDRDQDNIRVFDPLMQEQLTRQTQLEHDLPAALAKHQLLLHYQPQTDQRGRVKAVEALLRWQHPEFGLVAPGEIIPVAERSGQIQRIDRWVITQACSQLEHWQKDPLLRQLRLSINISAPSFMNDALVDHTALSLSKCHIPHNRLMIEITETLVLKDLAGATQRIRALQALGVHLSLDDFGTGYSSLSHLTQLPVQQIKIERAFVQQLPGSHAAVALVRAIASIAQELKIEVVAEGVETTHQAEFLCAHHCDMLQGFLYSRPLSFQKFAAYVHKHGLAEKRP